MWQPYRVLLMGVPTLGKVGGRSQAGAVYDWISSRDVHQVFYSGFGDTFDRFMAQVIDIREDILNQPTGPGMLSALFGNTWPRFYNTVSKGKTMNIINYQEKPLPLFPIEVEAVIVLTNPQYRRQIKSNPNKLSWKAWYDARNIPVMFMREDGIFDTT
ncbi:hypothetical protein CMK18_23260 [Candidatus Poribacteria bacterium]|nr:hypothetical protein [Candidatus Poribacteria bacterium]